MNGRFFALEARYEPTQPQLSCGPDCECGNELGCKKCQDGRRKKKRRQSDNVIPDTSTMPEAYWNLNGPRAIRAHGGVRHELGHQALGQVCPVTAPASWPDDLNCQRDGRGNAVCSNGMYFPPGCPHTPPDQYFSPGIAPDEMRDGALQAKIPPPRTSSTPVGSSPATPSAAPSALTIAAGVGALGAVGTALFFLFRR